GARQDAKEYIYASDLLILPSLAEAMPIVILEAMALKTPVIASNVDGISELIDNDKSGLLFSPLELDSFVEAFTHILSNPSKAMQYSNNAFEKYWSCFSINNQIRKYNEFLKEVLIANNANNYLN
ncbi:MAG: glycosyltransferase family 4 protein, partial [Thermodesulfobacteriota bacterium]